MPQLAITLTLAGLDAERVEDACMAAGALAITYRDLRDDPILEPAPGEFRLWPHSELEALFPFEASPLELVASIAGSLDIAADRLQLRAIQDRAWEREWLKDFKPMRFGARLWVAPHESPVHAGDAVIVRLDPGLAFGTGTHPTTAMCLEWLDQTVASGVRAIDYGCGSGVLALAASKLGAADVQAFDIDPQALTATRDNAAANDLTTRIRVLGERHRLQGPVDLLMANILAGPLCELAPSLAAYMRPEGKLVLAGLLTAQADEVSTAYAPWFAMREFRRHDGWVALEGTRLARNDN
jgi:ribosomal protein L11 methyltransferase